VVYVDSALANQYGYQFKVYVRPLVEYASPIWSPRLTGDIDMLERVQRRFTKRLPGMYRLSYEDRLQLNLDSLESRRIKIDLLLCFKIMHGYVDFEKMIFSLSTVIV